MIAKVKNNEKALWKSYRDKLEAVNQAGVFCLFSDHRLRTGKYRGHTIAMYGKSLAAMCRYAHKHRRFSTWNWWVTVNALSTHKRCKATVLGLNGIYCDIDCEKHGIGLLEFEQRIKLVLAKAGLPEPNIILSGHGYYFIWRFKHQHVVHNQRILNLWQRLEDHIIGRTNNACYAVFGTRPVDTSADDPCRLLRLVGTNNVKDPRHFVKCRMLATAKHDYGMLDYWVKNFLPKYHYTKPMNLHEWHTSTAVSRHPRRFGFFPLGVFWHRIKALRRLLAIRHHDMTGHRDLFLFIMATQLSHVMNNKGIFARLDSVNASFTQPLPKCEIRHLKTECTHLDLTKYHYRNGKIMDDLGATFLERGTVHRLEPTRRWKRKLAKKDFRDHLWYRSFLVHRWYSYDHFSVRKLAQIFKVTTRTIYNVLSDGMPRRIWGVSVHHAGSYGM